MQFQHADDEVEAAVAKRDEIGLGRDPHSAEPREEAEGRVGGDHPLDPRPARECARERTVVRAEVERHAKLPFDIVEALDQPIGDFRMQELDAAAARRTVAVRRRARRSNSINGRSSDRAIAAKPAGSGLTKALAT